MADVMSLEVEDGGPVVRRRADSSGAARLRAVGERLAAAAHPGVVQVRSSTPDADGWLLVTAHAGHALTGARARTPERLAAIGADVAGTLADLHASGLRHGRLDRDHVLIGPDGRAVLCGFGVDDGGAGPSDDVLALGLLLGEVAGDLASLERGGGSGVEQLRGLLAAATAERAERRPSARQLAAALSAVASPEAGGATRRSRAPAAAVIAAGLAVVGAVLLPDPGPAAPDPVGTTVPASTPVSSTMPSGEPSCVALADAPVDDPACGVEIVVEDGTVVVDGMRSVVGRAGDEIAVGDWDCDGTPDPAVLRPLSGEVLLFGPPDAAGARSVLRSTRVPGAAALDVAATEPGCASLGVVDSAGERTVIEG
jgi:hypothetical protein